MDVQLIEQLDLSREDTIDRRAVVRALAAARRRLEDERGPLCNFVDPRADMLLGIAADLGLDTIEVIEALGAELISERLWIKHVPELPVGEWNAWMDEHRHSTIAVVRGGADLQ